MAINSAKHAASYSQRLQPSCLRQGSALPLDMEKITPPSADLDQPYQCIALHPHEPHTELFKSFHYLRISVQHASMDRCLLQPTCSQMATVQVSQLSSVLTVSRLARDLHDMPTSCQLHPPAYQRHLAILQDESCHSRHPSTLPAAVSPLILGPSTAHHLQSADRL